MLLGRIYIQEWKLGENLSPEVGSRATSFDIPSRQQQTFHYTNYRTGSSIQKVDFTTLNYGTGYFINMFPAKRFYRCTDRTYLLFTWRPQTRGERGRLSPENFTLEDIR